MERLTAWSDYGAYFPKCFEKPCGGNGPENDCDDCGFMEDVCQKLAQYEDIGTLEEVREAVEKQKPKNPNNLKRARDFNGRILYKMGDCSECGFVNLYSHRMKFCPECGQRIDWSEEDEQ